MLFTKRKTLELAEESLRLLKGQQEITANCIEQMAAVVELVNTDATTPTEGMRTLRLKIEEWHKISLEFWKTGGPRVVQ